MKKAFTLVEMLVVIGILGILIGVLLASMSGGTESARATKCLTNMKNLANACQSYGMANGHYPYAGSFEVMDLDESRGVSEIRKAYMERRGWISWDSRQAYDGKPTSHIANYGWFTSTYNQDFETREYAITNGTLCPFVSANRDVYVCPSHVRKIKELRPCWSYVMNCYFGWDITKGNKARDPNYWGIEYGKLNRADRRLLFAELPFMGTETGEINTSQGSGVELDCTLQYKGSDGSETIGFNHSSGKKQKFAHVVFADGHTERILWPNGGMDHGKLRELTEWLCTGIDVGFNGQQYEKLTNK